MGGDDPGEGRPTFASAKEALGMLESDLTPECAAVVQAVLDALSAPAGAEDTRSYAQRYHDGLQEAMRQLRKCIVICITRCDTRTVGTA